ncbi:GNAT family protein [Streptomyces hygroscopicus]|uniref:GNAT family N-acetyltransferase n=1 Tax=Streptomyces hygroscopicus TaxID=1912 RepID=UPI0033D06005
MRAFGIRVGTDGTLAGTIGLRFAAEGSAPGQVNVAYGLYPSWWGRGLATRAVTEAPRTASTRLPSWPVRQRAPAAPSIP